jgi:hypothetical protein
LAQNCLENPLALILRPNGKSGLKPTDSLCGIISHTIQIVNSFSNKLAAMTTRSTLLLEATLKLLKPLVRLLLRHGVAYPSFAVALKQVFVDAAHEELKREGRGLTDSAVSLLSGVHRRDVRNLTRPQSTEPASNSVPMNMAAQVVARWMSQPQYQDAQGQTVALARSTPAGGFDALVASISTDVRPRAVLDEMQRLGIAQETEDGIRLLDAGFAPRQGFAEMTQLLQANIHDHLAAATQNLDQERNFLEQSIFVDQLTEQSAHRLHAVSSKAWRTAFKTVMLEATQRFEHDQVYAKPQERTHRARFGSYFYAEDEKKHDEHQAAP